MRKIPLREKRAWMIHMEEERWEPDRHDFYVLQLTNTVRALFEGAVNDLRELVLRPTDPGVDRTVKSREYVEMRMAERRKAAEMGIVKR